MIFNFLMFASMIICSCRGVSDKHIAMTIAQGACTQEEVTARCGAGGGCGGCQRTIRRMIREIDAEQSRSALEAERTAA